MEEEDLLVLEAVTEAALREDVKEVTRLVLLQQPGGFLRYVHERQAIQAVGCQGW